MPGDFTLGCLLGQYDRAQSFDVSSIASPDTGDIGSWNLLTGALQPVISTLFDNGDTEVHSSPQSLRFDVTSRGLASQLVAYRYGFDNDVYARWFPDVTTHVVRLDAWARIFQSVDSGDLQWALLGNPLVTVPIAASGATRPYRLKTDVHSTSIEHPRTYIRATSDETATTEIWIDDVLTQVDPIDIFPEWSFIEQERSIKSQHRSLGGIQRTHVWDQYFSYQVPLRWLSDSHTDLINWWWRNQFNLVFTLDTSDSESMRIVRITNQNQPIGSRIRPYQDQWQGTLMLESIDRGSLVF